MRPAALLAVILATLTACAPTAGPPREPAAGTAAATPTDSAAPSGDTENDLAAHDPSMIRVGDRYLVFSTHNGVEVRESTDLRTWRRIEPAFADGVDWVSEFSGDPNEIWAPDVSRHDGRYWLYYSASSFGSNRSAIGVATSPSGEPGSWTDHGRVLTSEQGDDFNAIDPSLLVDARGRWWLSFGSFWSGIKIVELDPATGKRKRGAGVIAVAARPDHPEHAVEAPAIVRHGRFYYLFTSFDFCCRGAASSYNIRVGRSTEPTGRFRDRRGVALLDGGGTLIRSDADGLVGPGGQSILRETDRDLLVHHWYAADDSVVLAAEPMHWRDGWPEVAS